MQKELIEINFEELYNNRHRMRVGTDDYTIYAMDKEGAVYKITDMESVEVSSSIWEFLGIEAEYLDEEIMDRVDALEEI